MLIWNTQTDPSPTSTITVKHESSFSVILCFQSNQSSNQNNSPMLLTHVYIFYPLASTSNCVLLKACSDHGNSLKVLKESQTVSWKDLYITSGTARDN